MSATMIHVQAMMADAWATAITVFGPDAGMALAEREALAVRTCSHDGVERLSAAFAAMLGE